MDNITITIKPFEQAGITLGMLDDVLYGWTQGKQLLLKDLPGVKQAAVRAIDIAAEKMDVRAFGYGGRIALRNLMLFWYECQSTGLKELVSTFQQIHGVAKDMACKDALLTDLDKFAARTLYGLLDKGLKTGCLVHHRTDQHVPETQEHQQAALDNLLCHYGNLAF